MFYIVNVVVDLVSYFLGEQAHKNRDIVCASSHFILVRNEAGGMYMLF